jgi:ribosomal protein S18 acetylase RimI-like enzyme
MRVERVPEADETLAEAVARLVPQLSPKRRPATLDEIAELVSAHGESMIVEREGEEVIGMLTLIVYSVPTGIRAWIHDVVVDETARGRGVGEALTAEALRVAKESGAISVELTTRQEREAANRLYRRLGFEQRETNVYAWAPEPGSAF